MEMLEKSDGTNDVKSGTEIKLDYFTGTFEFRNYDEDQEYNSSMLELDSFAFTKYIMKKWYNISSIYINIEYDELLNHYINKYFINK